jgi:hypothetical protein
MNYEYVKDLFNVSPSFSSTRRLWKHISTNTYYVSYDFKEIIKPEIDNSYMLLSEKSEYKTSPYRSYLSQNAKQLTAYDFTRGVVEYNTSYWKLN